jgi:hypothetical protein
MMYNHIVCVFLININYITVEIALRLRLQVYHQKLKRYYRCEQWIASCLYVVIDCAYKGGLHIGFLSNFFYCYAEMIRSLVLLCC